MEDDDEYESGFKCESCGGEIDPDDTDQYHEPSGWYCCPHCGHTNSDI